MKILWISNMSESTPFRTSRIEMCDALRAKGHDVTLTMAKNIGGKKSNNKTIYIPTIDQPGISSILFSIILATCFSFQSVKEKYDVVIVGKTIWIPFILLFKLLNIPIIMDIRSITIDKERSYIYDILFHFSKLIVSGYTTITPELRDYLIERYNIKKIPIGIWSSGVSLNQFNPNLSKETTPESKEKMTLMYHGSYSPTRGIESLIISISKLDAQLQQNIKLMLVGFSKEKIDILMNMCKQLKVENYIKFFPLIEYKKISLVISKIDIGIYPLPPEKKWWQVSFPLKTLEYLAMKKPVIVTEIPAHIRIFHEGKCGVLVKNNSPKELAKAIEFLYNNKNLWGKMGKNGRRIVENNYTWDKKADEFLAFIDKLV